MKHAIIGKGNLGSDLALELGRDHEIKFFSKSTGFDWPSPITPILDFKPDVVWVTMGHGSVKECKEDFAGAVMMHIHLPKYLLDQLPKTTKLVLFSTDYAASLTQMRQPAAHVEKPLSHYAMTKLWMENLVKFHNRPNTCVVRVGSLYGGAKPEKTFPGKLRRNFPYPDRVEVPMNRVSPTPTMYVARVLTHHMDRLFSDLRPIFHHCAPQNSCTLVDWAQVILGDRYSVVSKGLDPERPMYSGLGNTIGSQQTWESLWESSRFHFDPKFM